MGKPGSILDEAMAIKNIVVKEVPNPTFFPPMKLAFEYCKGKGIEIGAAAQNPFHLPGSLNLSIFSNDPESKAYKDFLMYRQAQADICGACARIDIAAEAHAVPLRRHSQNYVISSHVIEHIPDLISAFLEWNRILKPGGIIFIIFPKRDAIVEDAFRPLTPLEHFIEDFKLKRDAVSHPTDPGHGCWGHYHVFSLQTLLDLLRWCDTHVGLNWKVVHTEETDSKVGNGHTLVLKKKRFSLSWFKGSIHA